MFDGLRFVRLKPAGLKSAGIRFAGLRFVGLKLAGLKFIGHTRYSASLQAIDRQPKTNNCQLTTHN